MTGAQTTIKKAVTIDGNGFALSPNFIKSGNDNNATISVIGASNVTIRNLTINGTLFGNLHGINIYESSNVQLHGIVLNNNNAGVIVNSSTVFIENITTAGNRWYAVNVDQKTSQAASLTISGVSSHAEVDKPHVFIDNTNKVVAFIDAEGQYAMRNGVLYPNDAAYTLNMLVDPNNQNVQRFSGDVYRDIALDNCDGLDECKNQRTGDMLADWEMRLYKEDTNGAWQSVRSAVTDGNGKYNLGAAEEAGVYHVCEVLKAGWTQPIQTWNGSGYLVNTPNASGVADEGKYCTTTNYTDEKDNSSVSHFGNVDVSAPVVSNISISPRATNGNIGGTVTVTFDLNDAHPINIAKTRVLFSDGPSDANRARESVQNPVLVAGNTYKAVFNTKSFVKNGYTGNYNLGFNPYDSLGNQTSSKPASFRNILIDNTGPSIGNKTPVQNERIGGTYKVSATVTDQSVMMHVKSTLII